MARQSFFTRSQIVAIPIPWNIWKGIGERSTKKWTRMKYWIVKFKIDITLNLVEQGLPKSGTQDS